MERESVGPKVGDSSYLKERAERRSDIDGRGVAPAGTVGGVRDGEDIAIGGTKEGLVEFIVEVGGGTADLGGIFRANGGAMEVGCLPRTSIFWQDGNPVTTMSIGLSLKRHHFAKLIFRTEQGGYDTSQQKDLSVWRHRSRNDWLTNFSRSHTVTAILKPGFQKPGFQNPCGAGFTKSTKLYCKQTYIY